jgi:hypothetical protein
MGIKQTLAAINGMEAAGVIGRYAITGAIAAYNYVEAAVTEDLDILVSFDMIRITQFLNEGAVNLAALCALLNRHGLSAEWRALCERAGIANPCPVEGVRDGL